MTPTPLPRPARPADLYLRPAGLLSGTTAEEAVVAGQAAWLAGGPYAFPLVELAVREREATARALMPTAEVEGWAAALGDGFAARARRLLFDAITPRPAWAGLGLDRPLVIGVVNVTPDSFSDGGDHADPAAAVAHGLSLMQAGADILDVGGESTRPGADPVDPEEELARTLPVVRGLVEKGAVVSIDTRHARVMGAALEAGARIVNDVTALTGDPDSLPLVAKAGCPVVLMHMVGNPRTMQQDPRYHDAALDVFDALEERVEAARHAGIPPSRIAVDPGIGFGKTVEHNLHLLRHAALFHGLGCPILVGVSRKRFIGALSRGEPPKQRLGGSLAAGLATLGQGAQILRVHDVPETAQARSVWAALQG
ncbi:dihydropteroate synthase [Aerophototrophica crusticola]|uniref:dihydropteroate synthase n=1 Tax=Aerophototrophica crusticola TaxID=1709002 RepID=A0A858R866_9PROT|nr:dihydropteroate synthase [Rhodospirillaceae bacterium B3]